LFEREQRRLEGPLQRRQVEALGADPAPVALTPVLADDVEASMAVEELEEPMTPPQDIPPDGLATPEQVADRFLRLIGYVDGGQLAGAKEADKLDGIAAIRLDALAGSPRRQRGGHHRTRDPARGDLAVEIVARDARLVACGDRALAREALEQPPNELRVFAHLPLVGLT